MCMGGGGDGGAGEARAREAARQASIKTGMDRIGSIFDGGKYGTTKATGYDPNATYYTNTGEVWNPDLSGYTITSREMVPKYGPRDVVLPDPNARQRAYADEMGRSGLYTGFATSGGFDDNFFKQRRQSYLDYAMPQLTDQYNDAFKNLVYSLSRTGGLNSSTAAQQRANLTKTLDQRRQSVMDEALNQENKLRGDVETQRQNLITQLNASGDPSTVSASALNQAALLRSPTSFAPIGDAFSNITAQLAAQREARLYNQTANKPLNAGIGLFSGNNSQKVVN